MLYIPFTFLLYILIPEISKWVNFTQMLLKKTIPMRRRLSRYHFYFRCGQRIPKT